MVDPDARLISGPVLAHVRSELHYAYLWVKYEYPHLASGLKDALDSLITDASKPTALPAEAQSDLGIKMMARVNDEYADGDIEERSDDLDIARASLERRGATNIHRVKFAGIDCMRGTFSDQMAYGFAAQVGKKLADVMVPAKAMHDPAHLRSFENMMRERVALSDDPRGGTMVARTMPAFGTDVGAILRDVARPWGVMLHG